MTALQLADINFKSLHHEDTVSRALELMQTLSCTHLPVVSARVYEGLLAKVELLDIEDTSQKVGRLQSSFIPASVNSSAHFLQVVQVVRMYRTNIIPVVNDAREYQGSIVPIDLIDALGNFSGAGEYGGLIVLQIETRKLVLSELNAIIESDGATILHYNISPIAATPMMEVSIHVNKKDISTILATFEQYHYNVLYSSGDEMPESELSDNYYNLMNYLDI